ncbi:MAG: TIGR04086 family membrane protein [Ruminococcus sp.]|nr:TIGR04086 family membrane protein [Clostridia bacterium]MBR6670969.1 TIGR04086 family membrane protein [Ruminococcus sp.]
MSKIKNKKFSINNSDILNTLFKFLPCFLKGILFTVSGILVLSFAYYKMSEHSAVLFYSIYIFIALGGFFCGNSTFKKFGGRGIISGTSGSLPLALAEVVIILCFAEKISAFLIIVFIINLLTGALGGIIGANEKKRY